MAVQRQKAAPRETAFGMSSDKGREATGGSTDKIDPDSYISVELATSSSTVQVKRKRLSLGSEQVQCEEETKSRQRSRSRSTSPSAGKKVREKRDESRHSKPLRWVREGIQVRVVSKKVCGGKLYNRVFPVTTVLDQFTFEVFSKELNRPLTELRERDVETVLPRSKDVERETGCRSVVVVRGPHKGSLGVVSSIDKKRDKV